MRKLKMSELNRMTAEQFRKSEKTPLVLILENVRSAYNVGSVFRTADAFRIEALILCGITAFPPHKDIQKTALGATDTVRWKHFKNTSDAVTEVKNNNHKVYALEQTTNSINLSDFIPEKNEKIALILGNEVTGISEETLKLVDKCMEIPQFGTKHSLNISVSAGIAVWELFNKLKANI